MKIARYQVFLLLLVLTILAYVNTAQNGFIWDEELLITENNYIRNHTRTVASTMAVQPRIQ
jgi:hypothetical protein